MNAPAINAQFAPSPSALLHLGHAWLAMLGRAVADAQGGAFLLSVDDVDVREHFGDTFVRDVVDDARRVLEALECPPDAVLWLSRELPVIDAFLRDRGLPTKGKDHAVCLRAWASSHAHTIERFRYRDTFRWAASDYLHGVNPIIEGADLTPYMGLYLYACRACRLPAPEIHLLPRVEVNGVGAAKSLGATPASVLVAEYGATRVRRAILQGCLADPNGPVALTNVKPAEANVTLCAPLTAAQLETMREERARREF